MDRKASLDGCTDPVVQLHVYPRPRLNKLDLRTELTRSGDRDAGPNPVAARLVADGDAACRLCLDRNHCNRATAQLGPQLLLHGGEVGVQIQKKPSEREVGHGIENRRT